MKQFKYPILKFSSFVKPIVSSERSKYLSIASLKQLSSFIPNINEKNIDLLPFACNSHVANHVNLNGSVIATKEALETADLFINKFVNIEHDRSIIVGTILNVGFSEFGTDKPLTREEVSSYTAPFNVTVGGIIWKTASGDLADTIEDCSDPTSLNYQSVSASYEVGYDDFDIAVLKNGTRNLEDATIITDKVEIAKLTDKLQTFGGTGKLDADTKIALVLKGAVIPIGIALTSSPAAAVKGVAINSIEPIIPENQENSNLIGFNKSINSAIGKELVLINSIYDNKITDTCNLITSISSINDENLKNISQLDNLNVINTNINTMKITSIKDITDEALKVVKASSIAEFIETELSKSSEQWVKEKGEKDAVLKASQDKFVELEKTHTEVLAQLAEIKANLQKLEDEKVALAKVEKFNQRMAGFDEKYELVDADRQVLASQVKDLSDEAFGSFEKSMEVLLKSKNKEVLAAAKLEADKKLKVVVAATETTETPETVVAAAVTNATVVTPAAVATSTTAPTSLKEKYSKAFTSDQFVIKGNR